MNVAIEIEDALDEVEIPSKTYSIDFDKGRISGKCDGLKALQQSIHKRLITSRGSHPILYTDSYGSDLENAVLGDTPTDEYIKTVIPRLIKDCLMEDDRITDVDDVTVTFNKNNLFIDFVVYSDFGDFSMREVI